LKITNNGINMNELKNLIPKYKFLNNLDSRYPFAQDGFECSDGWYDVISEMLEEINEVFERDNIEDLSVFQIKEKFGGLRVYLENAPRELHNIVSKAEDRALETCELCGQKGSIDQKASWIRTLCEDHKSN
jgi:hypothetical protein